MSQTRLLFNRETNKVESIPESEITDKISSGKYTLQYKGIDIPVVAPDGVQTTIKSDDAEQSFRELGYRFLTADEGKTRAGAEIEQQRKEIFDKMPVTAFAAGVARSATFGISDLVAKGAGLEKEMQTLREVNPNATLGGEIAGAFTPIPGAMGKAATNLAAKAMTGIPQGVGLLGKMTRSAAEMGLGSAAEGALQGFGQGITEASLGDPSRVAENLLVSTGLGAGLGGLFGGGLGAFRELGNFAGTGITKAGQILPGAMRDVADKTVTPALRVLGRGDAADNFSALLRNPLVNESFDAANQTAIAEANVLAKGAAKGVNSDLKATMADAKQMIREVPKMDRAIVQQTLEATAGDIFKAADLVQEKVKAINTQFYDFLKTQTGPAVGIADRSWDSIQNIIKKLEQGTTKDKAMARDLMGDVLPMFGTSKMIDGVMGTMTAGEEAALLRNVKVKLSAKLPYGNIDKMDDVELRETYNNVKRLRSDLDSLLKKDNPNQDIAKQLMLTDKAYAKFAPAEKFFNQKLRTRLDDSFAAIAGEPGKAAYESRIGKTLKVMQDPDKADLLSRVLDRVDEFYPQMKNLSQRIKDIPTRMQALGELEAKVKGFLGSGSARDEHAVYDMLLSLGGDKKIAEKLTTLKGLKDEFANTPGMSAIDKYVRVKEVMDGSKDDVLKRLSDIEKTTQDIGRLSYQGGGPSLGVGGFAGTVVGTMTGSLSAGLITQAVQNPASVLKTIALVERHSNKAASILSTLNNKIVDTLSNPISARIATRIGTTAAMEQFKKQRATLAEMQNPEVLTNRIAESIGNMDETPQVQAALAGRAAQISQFLYSKMPQSRPGTSVSLTPQAVNIEPDLDDVLEFQRYFNAATNPVSVLENIQSGVVSPQEIETIKALYPQTFQQLTTRVVEHAGGMTQNLPYEKRLMLANLLGVPTDGTLTPEFVQSMQASIRPSEQQQNSPSPQGQPRAKVTKAPRLDRGMQTQISRISE